jgi:hypothetical protein
MIDKVSSLAEHVATGLSRRRFFTYVGRGGLALGAFLVGGVALGKKPPPPPPPPPTTCVLNGGCCGGAYPYLKGVYFAGRWHYSCSPDPQCGVGYLCAPSTCCHGGGSCALGTTCYSDVSSCNTLCV